MTAQALYRAGLPIGPSLVLPHPSNPDGHFEDAEIVEAHDDILGDSGEGWDYGLDHLPPVSPARFETLSRIAGERNARYGTWGFKDPRVCLLLDAWTRILDEPYVVVVVRHYAACIASLLHRAARSVAVHPPAATILRLWQEPDLAARMWLVHNRALVEYAMANPARTLVVHDEALLSGFPLASAVQEKFGIELDEHADTRIRRDARQAKTRVPSIDSVMRNRLDDTWAALTSLMGHEACTEAPHVGAVPVPAPAISEVFGRHGIHVATEPRNPVAEALHRLTLVQAQAHTSTDPTPRQAEQELAAMLGLVRAQLAAGQPRDALSTLQAVHDGHSDPRVLSMTGQALIQLGELQSAADILRDALARWPRPSYLRAALARCRILQGDFEGADELLEQLMADDPAVEVGPALLCQLRLRQGRPDDAVAVATDALQALPESLAVRVGLARALHRHGRTEDALVVAIETTRRFPDQGHVLELLASLYFACGRHDDGKAAERKMAAVVLADPGYPQRLFDALDRVELAEARRDLETRVSEQVDKLALSARSPDTDGARQPLG